MNVKRTEFEAPVPDLFRFRRNTLLEFGETRVVVSTVGDMRFPISESEIKERYDIEPKFLRQIGYNRYYETMAFRSDPNDDSHNIDVKNEVGFESQWSIDRLDADNEAIEMHERVIAEITAKLVKGEITG